MGRRSQRRAVRYESDQAGCIWGLIRIFDFRYGRSTRKLLSDRRFMSRNASVSSGVGTKLKTLRNSDEKLRSTKKKVKGDEESELPTVDIVKTSVKELMEEEMFIEQDSKKPINTAQVVEPEKKVSMESCGVYTSDSEQKSLDNPDLEGIMEELCQYHQRNTSYNFDMLSSDAYSLAEENLRAAIKVFTDERFKEDAKTHHSKEFSDALKTLSSNKELFLNLLKDPNSPLVKHIQSIDDARLEKEQTSSKTHRNFFKRRSKSQESNPLKENEKSQPSNRIVILKPGPTRCQNPNSEISIMEDNTISERNASQFSFTKIKRKLRHAMGKEKLGDSRNPGFGEKGVPDERVGWSSPNRNHFYTEKFAKPHNASKREENISKLRAAEYSGVSNIYIEAKKHLSDMLTNGDEKEAMKRQLPNLGRILSLPEYNFSPWGSPRNDGEPGFITAQMRLSPRGNIDTHRLIQEGNAVHLSSSKQEAGSQSQQGSIIDNPDEKVQSSNSCLNVTDRLKLDNLVEENSLASLVRDEMSFEGGVEIVPKTDYQQDSGILDVLCEASSSLIASDDQNHNTDEVCDEETYSGCLKSDSFEVDPSFSSPLVSPSSSSQTKKIEDQDSPIDKTERPSPVSVLEPFFTEDEISPSTTKSRPAIQPLQIRFDEGMCTRAREENEESSFEYVEAVLLASGLNWDDYLSNKLSSDQLLHPSLFDEVELFSNRHFDDQKLLFDCTNEVLKEVCERYFSYYSVIKHKVRPVPSGTSLIQEVWEGVEWHLLCYPPHHSLDQLVRKDMAKSGSWMDLQFEKESMVIELINLVLEEMTEETVFSFINEITEGEALVLLDEISEDERSVCL
ncbi:hypothetical protein LguiB_010856 [Lonicera macranthoides]